MRTLQSTPASGLLSLCSLALAVLLCGGAGCSKQDAKSPARTAPKSATAPVEVVTNLASLPAEFRQAMDAFGEQLQEALEDGDADAVKAAFDFKAMFDQALVGMGEDHPQLNDFKKGLRVGMSGTVKTMVDSWAKTEVKNKGAVISQGRPAVRFRFASSDSGIAFVDFILHAGKEGKPAIVNIYNQSLGYDLAVQLRQIATPILAELDKTVLERLVGKPGLSQAELQKFGEMSRKFAKGDNKGCVEDFKKLTPALRDSFAAYAIYINALQKAGDDAGYREALKQGALKFKQASFDFMLVDLYFMEKQYDKAAECIERFMQVVGRDAALLALESSLVSQKGDTSGAHKLIGEALKLEPDCEFAHTTALDIYLAAKDFAATRDTMIFLEENAGYEFKEAMGDPAWAEFLKSPEAARWK